MSNKQLEYYEELRDSLSVTVKIDHNQVFKVIIRDLIKKRNHNMEIANKESVQHFDFVLRYYLSDDDFIKYVIDKHEILP
jgi:hypothetical protein